MYIYIYIYIYQGAAGLAALGSEEPRRPQGRLGLSLLGEGRCDRGAHAGALAGDGDGEGAVENVGAELLGVLVGDLEVGRVLVRHLYVVYMCVYVYVYICR